LGYVMVGLILWCIYLMSRVSKIVKEKQKIESKLDN